MLRGRSFLCENHLRQKAHNWACGVSITRDAILTQFKGETPASEYPEPGTGMWADLFPMVSRMQIGT